MTAAAPLPESATPAAPPRVRTVGVATRLLLVLIAVTVLAMSVAATGIFGFSEVRTGLGAVGDGPAMRLSPAVRMVQATDALGEAARQLLWAPGHQRRLAARTQADYYSSVITTTARQADADLGTPLEAMTALVSDADRLATQRIDVASALPAARERVVVQIAGLTAMLDERRQTLTALERFHPDTQRELELHQEWARASKSLMGALLLTTQGGDGNSGAVSAVEAHLTRLGQITQSLPDSDFAVSARRQQGDIDRTVHGPQGIVALLSSLHRLEDVASRLNVDLRRAAGELSQSALDRVDNLQGEIDRRLAMFDGSMNRYVVVLAGLAAAIFVAVLFVALYLQRSVGARLQRLQRGLEAVVAGAREHLPVAGNDDIAACARAAGTLADMVNRREAELQHSRLRLELAIDATGAALWDENLIDGRAWWSPGYYRMLGYEPGALNPEAGLWETLVHPDDRAMATNAAERYLAGVTDSYCATFRLRRRDGTWIWVEDVGRIQRDSDGLPVRFVGLMRDISERRRAELRIRRAKEVAESAARTGASRLADAERRLNPQLRRLAAKLSKLESGPLNPVQQRQFAEIEDSFEDLLQTLAGLIDDTAPLSAADAGATGGAGGHDTGHGTGHDVGHDTGRVLPDLDSDSELLTGDDPGDRAVRAQTFRSLLGTLLDRMARETVLGQWGEAAVAARKAAEAAERAGALALGSACRRFADIAGDDLAAERATQGSLAPALADCQQTARDALTRVVAQLGVPAGR